MQLLCIDQIAKKLPHMLHETYKTLLTFFKDVSFQTINKGIRNLKKKNWICLYFV